MAAAAGAPRRSVRDRLALHPSVLRLKRAAASLICHPAVGAGLGWLLRDRIPCGGLVVETPAACVGRQAVAQLFFGIYEGAERRLLRRHLRRDLDVLELGSSIGVVSATIARVLDPGARLVCVEANADLVPLIRANLARNAPGRPVAIECAAVACRHLVERLAFRLTARYGNVAVFEGAAA